MGDTSIYRILNIFREIQAMSSRTGKESILKNNEDNEGFRKVLEFVYNPFIMTGIKEKKLKKFTDFYDDSFEFQFMDMFDAINYISKNNSGRDEDVKAIANFINDHADEEVRSFLSAVFTKTLKVGITAKTINKVYGKGTIPEFNIMLAKSYKDHGHKIKGEFYVTLKLDGIRCLAIKKNGDVQFFTRQGQPIDDLVEIEEELRDNFQDNYVYDGELLLKPNGMNSAELFRATQKVVRKDGIKKGLDFHVFDGLPLKQFMEGKSKHGYGVRRFSLKHEIFNTPYDNIHLLPVLYEGEDRDAISSLLKNVISQGKEGLMINTADGKYVTKRTGDLLKVKDMHTVDLRVIGYEEGSGKYTGTLGALIVDYKGYEVKVGSGYSEADRDSIWRMKDEIIGRVIEVQYFEESSNESGGISLRFPVFKQIREEGKEVSYD